MRALDSADAFLNRMIDEMIADDVDAVRAVLGRIDRGDQPPSSP
jgi:hypothetical protein